MDKAQIEEAIREEINKAEKEIQTLEALTKPISPENSIGRISRMDAINNKGVNDAALSSYKLKRDQLKRALLRIDESSFGKCGNCGNEIPEGRILLKPESEFCVNCAR